MLLLNKTKKSKKIWLVLALISLLLIGGGVYLFIAKPFNNSNSNSAASSDNSNGSNASGTMRNVNDVNYDQATDTEKKDSEQAKQQATGQQNNNSSSAGKINITITRAGQIGQTVSIRTFIDNATNGECNFAFSQGDSNFNKIASISASGSDKVCNLDVPTSEFTNGGEWNLNITAKNENATSNTATQKINLNL